MEYAKYETWQQLLGAIAAGYKIHYQAPMDYRPHLVSVVVRKDGKLRVTPIYSDADPFTADKDHFDRFRRASTIKTGCL